MTTTEKINAVLAQCLEDIGVVESPRRSNRGKRIKQMAAYTGLDDGYPWCAMAVAAWGVEALGASWPVVRSADCDAILRWAIKNNVLYKSNPKRGDIFLVMKSSRDAIHTGIVSSVIDDDTITSWEGNTNPGGSREGYGIFNRNRSRHNLWYVRWIDVMSSKDDIKKPTKPPFKPWAIWVSPNGYFPVVDVIDERPYSPIRPLVASILQISLEATEDVIEWDEETSKAIVNGVILQNTRLKNDTGWAPVREIAEALKCVVSVGGGTEKQPQRIVSVGPSPLVVN